MSDSDLGSRPTTPLPEAGNDLDDPNRPISEEHDTPPAPAGNPDLDMDIPENRDDSDESDLSEVDEAEFADFDPTKVALEDRPLVEIDEDVAKTLKASKRKRGDGEGKKKEGKREKRKRSRRDDDDEDPDGVEIDGKRVRKPKRIDGEGKERAKERAKEGRKTPEPENEEHLTPEERRMRALNRAMDAALKNPNKRRRKKKDEEDLENAFDEEIAALKIRMEEACNADNTARERNEPAIHKLKMLPEVIAILNRSDIQSMILDPETNFLQSVKYYMEPLNDGSLPAFNIQRDLFTALARMPIEREALLSSGIGKLVLYYTKSKKPEPSIKRIAERLLGEWSRPILKRSDDYKKRKIATKEYDFQAAQLALRPTSTQLPSSMPRLDLTARDIQRERILAPAARSNRVQIQSSNATYTIAPKSTFDPSIDRGGRGTGGSSGMDAFRRLTQGKGKRRG